MLSAKEELRYNRQIMLRQFDFDGQEALKKAKALIIGLGGLGCASSQYLAAAGVGHLTLVDNDQVELSNLHRQLLHFDARIGMKKVESAKQSLEVLNPHVKIKSIDKRLDDTSLSDLIAQHDVVLDCSDNLATRNQLNKICFAKKTPLVSGAAIRLEGKLAVFSYKAQEPCYQCLSMLFTEQDLSCAESGILSPVVGVIGSLQALESIKLIANISPATKTKVQFFDAMTCQWQSFLLSKNPDCEVCG